MASFVAVLAIILISYLLIKLIAEIWEHNNTDDQTGCKQDNTYWNHFIVKTHNEHSGNISDYASLHGEAVKPNKQEGGRQ